ncbi:MAG: tRNA-binding protein [Nitrososphaerales archaeon]
MVFPRSAMTYITYEDFKKLDLRVGKVISAERITGLTKVMKATVDLGEEKRELVVGGAEFYEPEYFTNKMVIIVANLEPKKVAGITSSGMLLAADVNGKPIWLTVADDVPAGSKIA